MDNLQPKYSIDSLQLSNVQSSSPLKILIVDDAEIDRVHFARYLQSDSVRSYDVIEAETLEKGLELWRSQQPDVVLLDMNLPDGDGLEFLEAISTDQLINKLPVIMLTGQGDERIAVQAMKFGAADYLVKNDVTSVSLLTSIAQVHENNLLFKQLRRSQEQQTVIASIALHIRRSLTFEAVANAIVQEIRRFLVADRTIIYRFNPDMSGEIVAEAVIPPWEPCLNAQIEDTCFQENFGGEYQKGKVFAANDIYEANLTECHIQLLERFQIRANLVAPILLNGTNTLWGLLIVHQCDAPRQWHEEDIQLLHQLSTHLAISLHQAELYQNLESLNSSLEEKVQERTKKLQLQSQVLEEIHDGVVTTDLNGTILSWNLGAEKLYGYTEAEVLGRNVGFMYKDSEVLGAEVIAPLLAKGSHATEVIVLTKSGKRIYISLRLSVVKDEQGNITHLIGCANDISDRKTVEASLRESEAKSRAILAAIPDLMFRIGIDQVYREMVTPYREVAVIPRGFDLVGLSATDILPLELAQQQLHYLQKAIQTGELQVYEQQIQIGDRLQYEEVRIIKSGEDEALFMIRDISDRKRSELELRRSESRFRQLFESDVVGTLSANFQGQITDANDLFLDMLGYTREELEAGLICWDKITPPEYVAADFHAMSHLLEYGTIAPWEKQYYRKDGSRISVLLGAVLLVDSGDQTICIAVDISDRKRAEQELQQLNQDLEVKVLERTEELAQVNSLQRAILESANYAIISTDLDGIIQTCNHSVERMLGYSVSELIGITPEILHDRQEIIDRAASLSVELEQDIPAGFDEVFIAESRRGVVSEQEWTYIRKDGSRFPVLLSVTALKDDNQQIIGFLGIAKDITERKQVEAELQNLSNRLGLALRSGAIGCWEWDLVNNIKVWDARMYEIYGLSEQDINSIGYERWANIIHPDDRTSTTTLLQQAISGEAEYNTEFRILHSDDSIHFIKAYGVVVRDAQGNPQNMIGINFDISDRKQTEAALIESESKFRRLVEGANDLIWATDANWCFNYLSPQFQTIFGFDPNDWIGKPTFNLVHPEDRERMANEYVQAIQSTQKFSRAEFRHRHQDGHYLWVSINTTLIMNTEGVVIGAQGLVTDISDRKRVEQEILENQRFIQQIADSSPNILYLYDIQEQRNTYTNREILTTLGYTPTEVQEMGASWLPTVIHPDDLVPTLEHFERLNTAKDSEVISNEYRFRHANGEWRYFYSRDLIFSRDPQGQVKLIIGTAQDITDRKITEAALRASDQRWQFALEGAGDGIWDWNVETNEVYFSEQWKAMLGYADDEIENRFELWENLVHPDDLAQSYEDINKCLNTETLIYENEHRLLCKDGSYKWILARGRVIEWGANGQVLRMMGTHTDLSDRKQAEIQLQQINEELLRATKLKDEFLANMSHELRTPLNSILGLSNALGENLLGSLNERQIKAIGTVESSGEHLLSLINDILDLSKISSGMMELEVSSVSVQNLCDSSLVFVKQQAFQKQVQINSNIPKYINKINVEERRIRQVLINLLTNAVKFTPSEGQVNLLVAVGSGDTWQGEATIPQRIKLMNSPMILFQVVDTGIGIASNDLQRLFQPFVQVSSSLNRQYEGTGLGLALVKQIVELHGGLVMAESEVGKGSCFSVALPYEMSQSSTPESPTVSTTLPPLVIDPDHAPLILLAEDNEANIQTFTAYLTAINYRIVVARNGREAVAMAKSESPDIIIMDIQMPDMDGLEAINLIRADASIAAIPIIALTALAMEGDRERCLAAGANEYLAKPIKFRQLNHAIQKVLA